MSFNNSDLNSLNLDTSVISVPLGKITLNGSVGTDLIIPESVSDSVRTLYSSCNVKVEEIFASNNALSAKGIVTHSALLLGDDGTIGHVRTMENFELKDFIEGTDESSILIYGGNDSDCVCRLINPRKLNFTSDISVTVFAMRERSVIPNVKGTDSIEDEISLRRRRGNATCVEHYSLEEKEIPVSHDVTLDGNCPPMSELVYSNIRLCPSEIITKSNSVTLKTKAVYSCIYKSEEGNIFSIEKPFILEKTIEADNAESYEWFASVRENDLTAEIAIDGYGEAKLIELDFVYNVLLNGIRNYTVETVTDAYSTEYDCNTIESSVDAEIYKRTYCTSLSVNASAARSEISAESVRNIMLGNVSIKNVESQYSDEKKRLIIESTAHICAACESNITSDTDPKFTSISFEYPFKCELDIGEKLDNMSYDVKITTTDIRFRCDQNNIYCDFENTIRAVVTESVRHSYLSEIAVDKSSPVSAPYAPITLCYPSGEESLWDIAKYYRITVESILASNNLTCEDISDKKVLLIPSYRKANPAFVK